MREGRGPGYDRRPAVLYRVRDRHERRETAQPPAQLHSRLLPHWGQTCGVLAPAHHPGLQKGESLLRVRQVIDG